MGRAHKGNYAPCSDRHIIEKTIRELADPPKTDTNVN
jgi:hypothetical protein